MANAQLSDEKYHMADNFLYIKDYENLILFRCMTLPSQWKDKYNLLTFVALN